MRRNRPDDSSASQTEYAHAKTTFASVWARGAVLVAMLALPALDCAITSSHSTFFLQIPASPGCKLSKPAVIRRLFLFA